MSEGPANEERRTWLKRNAWWCLPLVLCLAIAGVFVKGLQALHEAKQSVPYRLALELIQSDATIKQKLGEPVEPTWRPPDGEQRLLETGSGNANRKFDVVGSKGQAQVSVRATCEQFIWTLDEVEVRIPGIREPVQIELPPEGDPRRTREEVSRKNLVDPYAN